MKAVFLVTNISPEQSFQIYAVFWQSFVKTSDVNI